MLMISFVVMRRSLLAVSLMLSLSVAAQMDFGLNAGLCGLRNFSPQQKFWAIGQTIQANFHFSPHQALYASFDYYSDGKYRNNFTATAKSLTTQPEQIAYTASGGLIYRQVSLGVKHFFRGAYNSEKDFNIYGIAGFGFLFGKVRNANSPNVDTALYQVQPVSGEGSLKKLTFDLGLGGEVPIGANFFAYVDGRGWLPASSGTSPYLHNQKNVPLSIILSLGLRMVIGGY